MLGRDEDHKPAFVCHVEGIQPQNLAGRLYLLVHGKGAFPNMDLPLRRFGNLNQGESTSREVAQTMDFDLRVQQGQHEFGQRGAVALDRSLEGQRLPFGHDGDAVPADVAIEQNGVSRPHARGRSGATAWEATTSPTPDVLTKTPSPLPLTTLVSPVTSATPASDAASAID